MKQCTVRSLMTIDHHRCLHVPVPVILLRWMSYRLSVRSCTVAAAYRAGNYPEHQ